MTFLPEGITDTNGKRILVTVFLVIIMLIIGLLVITNTKLYDYLPESLQRFILQRKIAYSSILLWDSAEGITLSGMQIPETPATTAIPIEKYTMSVEMIWYNTRVTPITDGPYRHILHRGTSELASSSTSRTCMTGQYGTLPVKGLPSKMNPGIFADPVTNDMCIFITTGGPQMQNPHEMIRIPDIPLDIPFRLTIVIQRNYVEVYINCKLEVTKILEREPIIVPKTWYGISGKANLLAQIQNLRLWKTPLFASDIEAQCKKIVFTTKRQLCPGIAQTVQTTNAASVQTSSNSGIGMGDSLSTCN